MKRALQITSLFMLLSGCEKAALTAIFATGFLKEANKTYSDGPAEMEAEEYDMQPGALEVENIEVMKLE